MAITRLTNFRWYLTLEPSEMEITDGIVTLAPVPVRSQPTQESSGVAIIDLENKILLPSYIDSHCHILPTGLDLQKLPLGDCYSHAEVLDKVAERVRESTSDWVHAVQYEQSRYEGGEHLTRHDLDKICDDRPILLRHVNGHASVANSEALRRAGVDISTPNPAGGEYVRDSEGVLTGVLLETAHEHVTNCSPLPSLEEMISAIIAAGEAMAEFGIGTATDMMTGRFDLLTELEAYREAARRGCKIRTRLYVQWKTVFGPKGIGLERLRDEMQKFEDPSRSRIEGIKIFADGAIGSATAAIYGSYTGATGNPSKVSDYARTVSRSADGREVSGQLIYSPQKLIDMTVQASNAGFPVAIHAIGDYAVDLVLDAFEATGTPEKHRLEHAMILDDQQIARIKQLNCRVTFQPEFLYRFENAYLRQLGPRITSLLKRSRSVLDAGIRLSFNSDRPIVLGDPKIGILTAVNRPESFDALENISIREAIDAYTKSGAEANGDSGLVGTLALNEWADYQTLEPGHPFEALL